MPSSRITTAVVDSEVVVVVELVVVVGLGVVMGILSGVVEVKSPVTKMGFRWSEEEEEEVGPLWILGFAMPKTLAFSSSVVVVDVSSVDVDEEAAVGLNFGLFHKLSAPPCKNQGGNGLFVVVAKMRGAHAK